MSRKNKTNIDHAIVTDRAIQEKDEDKFHLLDRLVKPMADFIKGTQIKPCTVALLGEWGSGKTSALNLLEKELKNQKNSVIIDFDPAIEGTLELHEILESFYLKLYSTLAKENSCKNIIKKTLKSLMLMSRSKISLSAGIAPGMGHAGAEYDLGKNLDEVMALWEKEQPQLYSEKVACLNKALNGTSIYVIIDEIDRLSSGLILNFLMFARILESFDNMACIVAFDYTKVINKLINEKTLGFCDYHSAASYVDKLFQIRFDVCNSLNSDSMTKYAIGKVNEIFEHEVQRIKLLEAISNDNNSRQHFQEIINYLATPRGVNKWLMNLLKTRSIIVKSKYQLNWLAFVAVYTKYPIILDNFIRKLSRSYLTASILGLRIEIENIYGTKINQDINDENLKLLLAGIKPCRLSPEIIKRLSSGLKLHVLEFDDTTEKYVKTFLNGKEKTLVAALLNGIADVEELNYIEKFFSDGINETLQYLIDNEQEGVDLLAEDLAKDLNENHMHPSDSPNISLLNDLWHKKIGTQANLLGNPYGRIIFPLLKSIPVKNVVAGAILSLSEDYICRLLELFGIKNKDSAYNLSEFLPVNDNSRIENDLFSKTTFKNLNIKDFSKETIKEIVSAWLTRVTKTLVKDENKLWFLTDEKISVLCRYVQWHIMLGNNNAKQNLAKIVKNFLENDSTDNEAKKDLIKEFVYECRKCLKPGLRGRSQNPIDAIFNRDSGVVNSMITAGKALGVNDVGLISQVNDHRLSS